MDKYKAVGDIWAQHGKAYEYYLNDMLKNQSVDMPTLYNFGSAVTDKLGTELTSLDRISASGADADFKKAITDYCKSGIRFIDETNKLLNRYQSKGTLDKEYFNELASDFNSAGAKMSKLAAETEKAQTLTQSVSRPVATTSSTSTNRFPPVAYYERFSVKAPSGTGEKYGVKDGTGKIVIPANYDWLGTALRYPEDDVRDNANAFGFFARLGNKEGFIRNDGKTIVPLLYDVVGHVSEGLIFVGSKGKYGFMDTTGKLVVPLIYKYDSEAGKEEGTSISDEIVYFRNGFAVVYNGSKYGLINKTGKVIVPVKYDKVTDFENGYCIVTNSSGQGIADVTGKEIIKPGPQEIVGYPFSTTVMIRQQRKPFVMSLLTGSVKSLPYEDVISGFNKWGLAAVQQGEKTGFVNPKGNEVIPPNYIYLKDFAEGMIQLVTSYGGKFAFFDSTGKAVTDFRYDEVQSFTEGMAAVQRNKKWGFISKRGAEEIPVSFDYLAPFHESLACAGTFSSYTRKFGFIDHSGNLVIPYEYDTPANFVNGKAYISKGGQWIYIDRNGKKLN